MRRFFVVVVILAGLFACSKSKQESLADIQKRKGMPVRVQKVADEEFTKEIYFTAGLKGYKQTSEFSPISAEVSGIEARVGQKVKKNQVVIRFPDDKPSANYLQAKSAYDNSEKIYRRMKKIFAKGGISKQEMDNVATQYKVDKANFESASKLVAITSPISGVMTAINVSLTDNISQGDFLFTVSDLSKLKAKLQASEAQIVQMREGQKVRAVWNDITLLGELKVENRRCRCPKILFRRALFVLRSLIIAICGFFRGRSLMFLCEWLICQIRRCERTSLICQIPNQKFNLKKRLQLVL